VAAVLGDLLQIVDFQTYLEQQVLNVYYYRVTSVTGFTDDGYESVADWFDDNVVAAVLDIQNAQANHYQIEVRNLSNGIDIFAKSIDEDGTDGAGGADAGASFLTVGFKLVRESLVTRNGYKRFSGINEDNTSENQFFFPTGTQAALETALAADIVVGLATLCEPIIVKRPIGVPPVASYDYSSIGSAQYAGHMGTQNTRKPGRGI